MAIEAALIAKLAIKLIDVMKDRVDVDDHLDRLLDEDHLKEALELLNLFGDLDDIPFPGNKVNASTVTAAIKAIKALQEHFGITADGFLGSTTLNFLKRVDRCCETKEMGEAAKALPKPGERINPFEVRIFIERLPGVQGGGNPKILFTNAWQSWMLVCGLGGIIVSDRAVADVIVTTGSVDKARFGATALAIADVGLQNPSQPSTLTFDKDAVFSTTTQSGMNVFEAACLHEIGHLLGLSHKLPDGTKAPRGSVMFEILQPQLLTPTPFDINRVRNEAGWGPPKVVNPFGN